MESVEFAKFGCGIASVDAGNSVRRSRVRVSARFRVWVRFKVWMRVRVRTNVMKGPWAGEMERRFFVERVARGANLINPKKGREEGANLCGGLRSGSGMVSGEPKGDENQEWLPYVEAKFGGPAWDTDEVGHTAVHLDVVDVGRNEGKEHKDEAEGGAASVAFGEQADTDDNFSDASCGVYKFGKGEVGWNHG